jgi:predicted dehydrogenase
MANLRGGLIGCGYFARNHMHAWNYIDGVEIAAICDADRDRAVRFGTDFGVESTHSDAAIMLRDAKLDFVDIVTQPASHRSLVELAAANNVPVICQKPLALSLDDAEAMTDAFRTAGLPFMVHENFRWQRPMRAVKAAIEHIGPLFFGRVSLRSGFDVYANQPYLATDPRFILIDLGVHLLDLARFFMGDAASICCRTQRVNPRINGEDVATALLGMQSGATCLVDMSYASRLEEDLFPQTLVHIEGRDGSVTLGANYRLSIVSNGEVQIEDVSPNLFSWSSPPGQATQEAVVAIQTHWCDCLQTGKEAETSGEDNLKTLDLVFGAYESAETGEVFHPGARPAL